ncbi:hypothetical protein [Candidatus Methylacidiphilum fumarolicum]|uniref:hypothetical protein n=1 Tax=Candidatus Methylacidiphilum fumarolicum TaxID=591154 RepID=UPI0003140F5E|nr:hypothetical protein [Candidatus Methylacidiphilum fumarolicum]
MKPTSLLPLFLVDARQPDEQLAEAFPILLPMIVGEDLEGIGIDASGFAFPPHQNLHFH